MLLAVWPRARLLCVRISEGEGQLVSRLVARKPLDDLLEKSADAPDSLRRSLTAVDLVMLGVGAIVGVGIFVITGQAAANYAGPGILLSFVLAAFACGCAALCYSEMAAMIPIAGSAYTFAYVTVGEFIAWMIGWDLVLEYSVACATVSAGWSGYVLSLLRDFGLRVPDRLSAAPYVHTTASQSWISTGAVVNLPAILIAVLVTILLVLGIRESANVNTVIVIIKIGVIATFVVAGVAFVHRSNWRPFIPANTGQFGHYGWSGVLRGAAVVFIAYIGFDAVSTAAQEARNPQRDVPRGIIGSLIVCTVLYLLVAGVLTGIVSYRYLDVPDPIAVGIDATRLLWLRPFIKIGAIAGLSSVILVMMLGQSRVFWAMAGDGLLPPLFSIVHQRFRTPYVSTVLTGTAVAISGGLLPIDVLAELLSIGTLSAFILVCGAVWLMRRTRPEMARPFRTPLVPLIPILGMSSCLYLIFGLPPATWLRFVIWMILGIIVYFAYGRQHSKITWTH
jgi:basic amino acid/polyamine antiporter, APA family